MIDEKWYLAFGFFQRVWFGCEGASCEHGNDDLGRGFAAGEDENKRRNWKQETAVKMRARRGESRTEPRRQCSGLGRATLFPEKIVSNEEMEEARARMSTIVLRLLHTQSRTGLCLTCRKLQELFDKKPRQDEKV